MNTASPSVLAEESALLGAALAHYSTDYVINGEKREPYSETEDPIPLDVYGATKLQGEQAIQPAPQPR